MPPECVLAANAARRWLLSRRGLAGTKPPGARVNAKPNVLGHRQRLRDRFLKAGPSGFADHEVVELLLTLAIPRKDVKQPAKALMARFGSLRGILDAPIEEVQAVPGIGPVTPVALRIIRATATPYL